MGYKIAYTCIVFIFVYACGPKKQKADNEITGNEIPVFSCTQSGDRIYITDTVEQNIIMHYPDSAGYEINYSESLETGYDIVGEFDKADGSSIRFIAVATAKQAQSDEKEHFLNEIKSASAGNDFEVLEQGELHDVLYSRYYAIAQIKELGRDYKGFITLHFDPKWSNYYFVLIQTADTDAYRADFCMLYPFVQQLRFLKNG